jgi:hypothetical protein
MHYTPNGTATEDSTRIGLVFAKEEPKYEVRVASVVNTGFRIPAGDENYPVVGSIKNIPADVKVLAFLPHMHLRGKAAKYELISGGNTRTLLDVPRYDFNWQLLYRYAEPLSIKAGDTIQYTAWQARRGGGGNAGGGREDDSQPVEESEQGRKISAAMMDYWIAFMKDGKPSGKDLPDWPAYQPTEPKVMVFGNESIAAK